VRLLYVCIRTDEAASEGPIIRLVRMYGDEEGGVRAVGCVGRGEGTQLLQRRREKGTPPQRMGGCQRPSLVCAAQHHVNDHQVARSGLVSVALMVRAAHYHEEGGNRKVYKSACHFHNTELVATTLAEYWDM
jgi:hypothetical protein